MVELADVIGKRIVAAVDDDYANSRNGMTTGNFLTMINSILTASIQRLIEKLCESWAYRRKLKKLNHMLA